MKKPRRPPWGRRSPCALPDIQPDMVMVIARGDESGLRAITLSQVEAEDAAVKIKGALKVGNLQVDMANPDAVVDRTLDLILLFRQINPP